jgi:hypothetical protein
VDVNIARNNQRPWGDVQPPALDVEILRSIAGPLNLRHKRLKAQFFVENGPAALEPGEVGVVIPFVRRSSTQHLGPRR